MYLEAGMAKDLRALEDLFPWHLHDSRGKGGLHRFVRQRKFGEENLEMGAYCRYKKGEKTQILQDMGKLFGMFPILRNRIGQKAGTLSGG